FREPGGERRSRHDLIDAGRSGRGDRRLVHVRHEAERADVAHRRVVLDCGDGLERRQLLAVQIEDHERRLLFAHARYDTRSSALEEQLGSQMTRSGRYFDAEDEIVDGTQNHWINSQFTIQKSQFTNGFDDSAINSSMESPCEL